MLAKPYFEGRKHSGFKLVVHISLAVFFCSVQISSAMEISDGSKTCASKLPSEVIYGQLQDELQFNPASSEQRSLDLVKGDIDVDPRDMTLETLITALEKMVLLEIYEKFNVPGIGPD